VARALGDVLHHFDPALAAAPRTAPGPPGPRPVRPRVLAVPVGAGDLLRAGAVWALAVEVARRGAGARLLCPAPEEEPDPWPEEAGAPLGVRVERLEVGADPERIAAEARRAAAGGPGSGLIFACIPDAGFEAAFARGLERALLLARPDPGALRQAEARIRRLLALCPGARVGVTVHGVRSVAEAREAFERLAGAVERSCGDSVLSYGLLVDDLALYRGIVERRPVGLTRPQSPAARALADVARLLVEDLEEPET